MNRSTPRLPVHHQLPESTQTHVHRVNDAIQPSHPLSSPSPPALNLSQHQGLFKWVSSSHQVDKVLEFQLQHQSFQWTPGTDLLQDGLVGSPCSPRDSQAPSPTPQFKSINSSALSFLYSPTLTSVKFNKIFVIIFVSGLEMPFPLLPKIILNLKTHHNMLWFPAVNRSLNGHRCKPLWPKSPPRKGRVDAEGGAENARLWAKPRQGSPGQSGWKRKFTHGSRVRTRSLSPGGASPGLPGSPGGSSAGVRGAGGRSRWVGVVVSALRRIRAPPPGRWGAARAALRALSCMPETQFHYSAEFGDSWSLRERQWWWSPFSRTGEHHSCHQWRSWQAPALPGAGGVVDYAAYLSSCSEDLPANEMLN